MNFTQKTCPHCHSSKIQKKGHYFVRILKRYRRRFRCLSCLKSFSTQTNATTFRQKRPDLNQPILELLTSGMPQRGIARFFKCSKNTVDRKLLWLGKHTPVPQQKLESNVIYLDEMESIEHTKLKPLTIAIAVSEQYQILASNVGRIPAKGHLAKYSVQKYGYRKDERENTLRTTLIELKRRLTCDPKIIRTDQSPHYSKLIKEFFPNSIHERHNAKESIRKKREMTFLNLKKKVFDPLFPVNQRAAKLRADLKRLTRRSWCTTKSVENLSILLNLYKAVQFV